MLKHLARAMWTEASADEVGGAAMAEAVATEEAIGVATTVAATVVAIPTIVELVVAVARDQARCRHLKLSLAVLDSVASCIMNDGRPALARLISFLFSGDKGWIMETSIAQPPSNKDRGMMI